MLGWVIQLFVDVRSGAPPGPTPGYGGGPGPNQGYPPAGAPSGGYGGGGYGPSYGSGYEGGDGYGSPMSPRQQGYSNRGERFSGNQGPPVQVSNLSRELYFKKKYMITKCLCTELVIGNKGDYCTSILPNSLSQKMVSWSWFVIKQIHNNF